jgi:hypothetical protein
VARPTAIPGLECSFRVSPQVRSGSKADLGACLSDVRFTPTNRHQRARAPCPLSANSRRASPIQALVSRIGTPRRLPVCGCIIRVGEALGSTARCRRLTLSQSTIATPNRSAVYGRDLHANGITRIVGLSLYCGSGRHHSRHEDCPNQCAHLSLHYVQPIL